MRVTPEQLEHAIEWLESGGELVRSNELKIALDLRDAVVLLQAINDECDDCPLCGAYKPRISGFTHDASCKLNAFLKEMEPS